MPRYNSPCIVCCIMLLSSACQQSQLEQVGMGPETKANLVVVLRQHSSDREIGEFLEQNLIVGSLASHFRHREGIASLVRVKIQDHIAYAITFYPYATAEERAIVSENVSRSPLVYQIFEDAVPQSIRLK